MTATKNPTNAARLKKLPVRDNRWYGRRADLPDPRDLMFEHVHPKLVVAPLPESVDMRTGSFLPSKVWDQGQLGSCVAHGAPAAFVTEMKKQGEREVMPSRLAVYYWGRKIEGSISSDSGLEVRDGIKALVKMGAPAESLWPYKISQFKKAPPAKAVADGTKHQALKYARVDNSGDARQMMQALAGGLPIVIGITVFESFESDEVARTGIVPMPEPSEQVLGGHCLLIVGYKADAQKGTTFIVRNSWGASWGDKGYCYIPGQYLIDPQMASDFWVLSSVE